MIRKSDCDRRRIQDYVDITFLAILFLPLTFFNFRFIVQTSVTPKLCYMTMGTSTNYPLTTTLTIKKSINGLSRTTEESIRSEVVFSILDFYDEAIGPLRVWL